MNILRYDGITGIRCAHFCFFGCSNNFRSCASPNLTRPGQAFSQRLFVESACFFEAATATGLSASGELSQQDFRNFAERGKCNKIESCFLCILTPMCGTSPWRRKIRRSPRRAKPAASQGTEAICEGVFSWMEKCIEFHKPDPTNRMGVVCCACLDLKRRMQMNILRKLVLETLWLLPGFCQR